MIIVTGTKRSGTSMWMQILIAAGYPPIGEAFPAKWRATIKDANPEGFYESSLRHGIYFATNPNPETGQYLFPEQVEHHVVKVFIPGLVRTDRSYIGRVIATMRDWREYEASIRRLDAIEEMQRPGPAPERIPPALEWWAENYALVRDISTRRYAVHVEAYDRLMRDPETVIAEAIRWLGRGDAKLACEKVKPEHRHFERPESMSVEPRIAEVFDELYSAVSARKVISKSLIEKLNETNRKLVPVVREYERRIADARERQSRASGEGDAARPEAR